jgi:hypothetical protein
LLKLKQCMKFSRKKLLSANIMLSGILYMLITQCTYELALSDFNVMLSAPNKAMISANNKYDQLIRSCLQLITWRYQLITQ